MIDPAQPQPGDLVFCHSKGIIGRAIRLGEWLRWRGGSHYNHVAILDEWQLTGWTVIQAEARGVTRGALLSDVAPGGSYVIVSAPPDANRADLLSFARAQVGTRYGFLTIASLIVTILTPVFFNVMAPGSWICSAVAAESIRCGGWIHNWPDVYQVTPAQLFLALSQPDA